MSKINYQLRPAKHIERKIFVEVLNHLRGLNCNISDYHYVGLGAPYFIDFLLFHKHLYINKMTSFENNPGIIGRVKFNSPFAHINIIQGDATDGIAGLVNDKQKYLIWLDYECSLNSEILDGVGILAGILPEGSILIVTVNVQLPPVYDEEQRKSEISRYVELFSPRIPGLEEKDIAPTTLKKITAKALKAEIERGSLARTGEDFIQLFNYSYADGATMLTFGGIIKKQDMSFNTTVSSIKYVNQSEEPKEISVPMLTHKERMWLDAYGSSERRAAKTALTKDDIDKYFEFAAHYPTYYEILI